MNKLILGLLAAMLLTGAAYADDGVHPELATANTGTAGQVFIANGGMDGENVLGHFVNPMSLGIVGPQGPKGDKGDTGATGSTGAQGIQGIKGDTGPQGVAGAQGATGAAGTNGSNGLNGKDGKDGAQGPKGDKGNVGATGAVGPQGVTGTNGVDGAKGDKGDKGDTGATGLVGTIEANGGSNGTATNADTLDVVGEGVKVSQTASTAKLDLNGLQTIQSIDNSKKITNLNNSITNLNNRVDAQQHSIDRLEQTKYILEPVVRVFDTNRWQGQVFDSYDVRHGMNFAIGARLMYKLGKSYEEKRIDAMNRDTAKLLGENVADQVAERKALVDQLTLDKQLLADQAEALKQAQAALLAQEGRIAALEGVSKSDVDVNLGVN